MIPIGIELDQKRKPILNYVLIGANVLLFLLTLTNEPLKNQLALPARDLKPIAEHAFFQDLALFTLEPRQLTQQQLVLMKRIVQDAAPGTMDRLRLIAAARAALERKLAALKRFADDTFTESVRLRYVEDAYGYRTGGLWGHPYTLITHGFMHASWMHLIGNMIFLWLFGNAINGRLGHLGYGASYLFFLLCAAFAHYFLTNAPAVGASGAIAGVTGACLIYYPFVRVRALVPIFYIYRLMKLPIVLYIGFEFAYNLWMQFSGGGGGVAWWAHIGGYIAGFALAAVLVLTGVTRWQSGPFDLFAWLRQRRRRRELSRVERTLIDPYDPRRQRRPEQPDYDEDDEDEDDDE